MLPQQLDFFDVELEEGLEEGLEEVQGQLELDELHSMKEVQMGLELDEVQRLQEYLVQEMKLDEGTRSVGRECVEEDKRPDSSWLRLVIDSGPKDKDDRTYKDAKSLFAAIETRFGGNEATKKTHKTLLKQIYENFSTPSIESLDSIFNRLQKIVSQLAILGEFISQEDLNLKFLRSMPSEWNTHVVVWRNKPDLDTMSIDDLYNNFKILAPLSMRAKRFFHKTGKKITINGSDKAGFDKSKVECYNCHKMGYFTKECRGPRNQDSRNRYQDSSRRTVHVEESPSKAMVAINRVGFDWSYMVEDEVPTNMALMAFLDFEDRVLDNKDCSVESPVVVEKKTVVLIIAKVEAVRPKQQEKPVRNIARYAEIYMSQGLRGNQRNWNNLKSQQLGSNFVIYNKAGFVCGSFDHLQAGCNYHQRERVVNGNNYTRVHCNYSAKKAHPSAHRNMSSRVVLMKTGLRLLNTTRPRVVNTARPNSAVGNVVKANQVNAVKALACWVWRPTKPNGASITLKRHNYIDGHPQKVQEDQGYVDSRCSRHMAGNMSYLSDFKEFNGGYVTFDGGANGGRITVKGTIKTGNLDFEDVYFVNGLKFNLFSVSQMYDKKNNVLFTNTKCLVLSPNFKLPDESQILLRVSRNKNMYSVDMKKIVPKESLTCLVAKATLDESMIWHRRLGHIKFKNINKLVKDNLVRGLPSKYFENDQTCIACLKGKQHKASCILKKFITEIENLVDKKVKVIRCDNGTEFKNSVMNDFCAMKGIRREFRNRVLVVKPHNKTLYELIRGRTPSLSFMRPFRCHVTILNTLDYLGKFDGKCDEGFFVGYSLNSKAFRVYKTRTRKVEDNLHVRFLKDNPIIAGDGPKWLFDIDVLTKSMNYVPVVAGTNSNGFAGTKDSIGADKKSGASNELNSAFEVPGLENIDTYDDFEEEADFTNLESSIHVSPTLTTRIHKKHPLKQEVYVCQPLGFEDPDRPDKVYKVVKALYDLHQDPRAWYETLAKYLLGNGFYRGKIYQTIKLQKPRLQVKQKEDGIFISHDKYVTKVLRKFNFLDVKSTSTLVDTKKTLVKDADGDDYVYVPDFKSPKVSHLYVVKRFFKYLKGHPKLGLWYPRDSLFKLVAYTDSDYTGASLDKKSTTGDCQFLGSRLISLQCKKQTMVATSTTEAEYVEQSGMVGFGEMIQYNLIIGLSMPTGEKTATVRTVDNGEQEITATVDGKEFTVTKASVMRHLQLAVQMKKRLLNPHNKNYIAPTLTSKLFSNMKRGFSREHTPLFLSMLAIQAEEGEDEVIYKEWNDRVEKAATTAASIDAEQASGGSPRCQEAMGVPLLRLGPRGLKLRVKKLEKKKKKVRTPQPLKRRLFKVRVESSVEENLDEEGPSKQGRSMIEEIDQDTGVTLVQIDAEDQERFNDETYFDACTPTQTYTRRRRAVSTGSGGISTASRLFSTAEESVSTAGASMPVSTVGMVQRVNISISSPVVVKDKGEGKMEESKDEQTKRTKLQQEQDRLGDEAVVRIQEELEEKERQRMARRKRYFVAQKPKAKRNKPMTQAQQRTYMSTYIKNVGSYTLNQLKKLSFDEIKKLFETTMKIVNIFVPIETEVRGRASELAAGSSQATITNSAEVGSSKRAAEAELDYEGSKRQKTNEASGSVQEQPDEEENELSQEDLQHMMMVVPVEEVYVEALQVKYPIIDWEIYTK
uniref:Ribonuclease H-like domain-containing protein n=1 Tax=Tanacetum cinerariifolium TaxID=118510 RepID=A0A6L2L898_TANCI|nr:ribonuclease H-like domain-containing protein [Tanacetum cinerariifolium]